LFKLAKIHRLGQKFQFELQIYTESDSESSLCRYNSTIIKVKHYDKVEPIVLRLNYVIRHS